MSGNRDIRTPQTTALLRTVAGGYLVYLAYDMIHSGEHRALVIAASVLFLLAGIALIVMSLRSVFVIPKNTDTQKDKNSDCEEHNDEQ